MQRGPVRRDVGLPVGADLAERLGGQVVAGRGQDEPARAARRFRGVSSGGEQVGQFGQLRAVLVAKAVTGAVDVAQVLEHTPIGDDEMLVRMPSRMRATILSALSGEEPGDDGVAPAR
ncbi:hypothetical protein [Actinomadura sp. 9N215]|uniref:hypothetical protein n=1 Tax=Actinomadura sp. 9N215 TaxID=3375150 RepID=UPI0037B6277B